MHTHIDYTYNYIIKTITNIYTYIYTYTVHMYITTHKACEKRYIKLSRSEKQKHNKNNYCTKQSTKTIILY